MVKDSMHSECGCREQKKQELQESPKMTLSMSRDETGDGQLVPKLGCDW